LTPKRDRKTAKKAGPKEKKRKIVPVPKTDGAGEALVQIPAGPSRAPDISLDGEIVTPKAVILLEKGRID